MIYRALALCALVAGCGYFDSETIEALTDIRPLEDDLGQYEVIVDLPKGLGILPGGARMTVMAERSDTMARTQRTYVLQQGQASDGRLTYRLNPADLAILNAQQTLIREWEAETDGRTRGQFSMAVDACAVGAGPSLKDLMSVTLRERGGPARTIIPPTPVRDFVLTAGNNELMLGPCPGG